MKRDKKFLIVLISFFIAVVIPVLLSGIIMFNSLSNQVESDLRKDSLNNLGNISMQINTTLKYIEASTIHLGLDPIVLQTLRTPHLSTIYDYRTLQETLSRFIISDEIIESVYLYINAENTILTTSEGLFDASEYPDYYFIYNSINDTQNSMWYSQREIPPFNINDLPQKVLTFRRRLPLIQINYLGEIYVNLNISEFESVLEGSFPEFDKTIFFNEFSDDKIVFLSENQDLHFAESLINNDELFLTDFAENDIFLVESADKNYYVVLLSDPYTGWFFTEIIPESDVRAAGFQRRMEIYLSMGGILIIGLVIAGVFSTGIYKSWNILLVRIGDKLRKYGYPRTSDDRYDWIYEELDKLICDEELHRITIENSKPLLKDKLITDILTGNVEVYSDIAEKLEQTGITFEYKYFLPGIMNINKDFKLLSAKEMQAEKKLIKEIAEKHFRVYFHTEAVYTDTNQLSFITNTELPTPTSEMKRSIDLIAASINTDLETIFGTLVNFCISNIGCEISQIYMHYFEVKEMNKFTSFMRPAGVAYNTNPVEEKFFYPVKFQRHILNGIKSGDMETVKNAIDELFNEYLYNKQFSFNQLQKLFVTLAGGVESSLWADGFPREFSDAFDIYSRMEQCHNFEMLKETLNIYFYKLIKSNTENLNNQKDRVYVSQAIDYIERYYSNDIQMNDIGEFIGINSIYLGRLFKNFTGKTMTEFLTETRMEQAKIILSSDKSVSVKEAGVSVGYYNVQSFNRFFKKYEGVTPGEYKKLFP